MSDSTAVAAAAADDDVELNDCDCDANAVKCLEPDRLLDGAVVFWCSEKGQDSSLSTPGGQDSSQC